MAAIRRQLGISWLLTTLFALPFAAAAPLGVQGGLGGAVQSILVLFGSIFSVHLVGAQLLYLDKGIIFFIVFSLLLIGAKKVFPDPKSKNIATAIAFFIGLFTLGIPDSLIQQISTVYTSLFYLAILGIPIGYAVYIAYFRTDREHARPRDHMMGALALGIALAIISQLAPGASAVLSAGSPIGPFAEQILYWTDVILTILIITKIIQAIGGHNSLNQNGTSFGRDLWNNRPWANRTPAAPAAVAPGAAGAGGAGAGGAGAGGAGAGGGRGPTPGGQGQIANNLQNAQNALHGGP